MALAYPVIYQVTYSYTGFQQSQGDNSFPGTQLDNDLAGLHDSLNSLALFITGALRSDGVLANNSVGFDQLTPSLQTAGIAPATAWTSGTGYTLGTPVIINNGLYRASISHTSGVFATDLAAGKWAFVSALIAPVGGVYLDTICDKTGVVDTAAPIRAYIDAQPAGAHIELLGPIGNFYVNSTRNGSVFDMTGANATKTLSILGSGWTLSTDGDFTKPQGTCFRLGPGISTVSDIFHFQPTGALLRGGVRFKDFAIIPSDSVNGTPRGRHGFFFDGSASLNAYIERAEIANVYVDNMATGYSIYSKAQDGSEGMLAGAVIRHCMLMQFRGENLGDDNTIQDNFFGVHATDDARNFGVYYYNVAGATSTRVLDNYILSYQGFIEDDGSISARIEGNECELSTNSNGVGFLIRATGSKARVSGATITRNRISQNAVASTATPIVIATADGAVIGKNWIATATDYAQIVVQASAVNTVIEPTSTSLVSGTFVGNMNVSYAGSAGTSVGSETGNILPLTNSPASNPAANYAKVFPEISSGQLRIVRSTGAFGTTINPLGGAVANQFVTYLDVNGNHVTRQPAVTDLTGLGAGMAAAIALAPGAANGLATLDGGGKLTAAQIPASLVGAVVYQGTWNATTNSPALASGVGTKGWYYKVATGGATTIDGNNQWNVGDTIIFDGVAWDKIDGVANEVVSVAGLFGVITAAGLKAAIATAIADITGWGANVAAALGNALNAAGGLVGFSGNLGTPTAGVATNLTGTAAGLTAGNVTTNANMTGDVTSVGNATTLTNAPVIAKVLTGLAAAAGTLAATDTILQAFNKLAGLIDNAAWTAYTPTFSAGSGAFATAGNAPVASGSFKQRGKLVYFKAKLVVGAAGVGTAAVSTILSLPVTAAANTGCYPTGRENQTSGSPLVGWQQTSTTNITVTTNASSFASGNSTTIEVSGMYEAA